MAPHALVCGDCNSLLVKDGAGQFIAGPGGRAPGKRACPRCAAQVPYPSRRCVNCGRTIHNAYRVAALATILVLVLLGSAVVINQFRRLTTVVPGGVVSQGPAPGDHPRRPPPPPPGGRPAAAQELKAAREMFVKELGKEYERKEAGIEVRAGGADGTVITFSSKRFDRAQVERLRANEEAMRALRNLGFREAVFTNGEGGEWHEPLEPPSAPR